MCGEADERVVVTVELADKMGAQRWLMMDGEHLRTIFFIPRGEVSAKVTIDGEWNELPPCPAVRVIESDAFGPGYL